MDKRAERRGKAKKEAPSGAARADGPPGPLVERVRGKCAEYWKSGQLRSDAVFLGTFVAIIFVINATVAGNVYVPTGSMRDTIREQERFVVRKLGYGVQNPLSPRHKIRLDDKELLHWKNVARGDIVVFVPPEETGIDEKYVKRLIGLPGERVEIRPGVGVLIDGELLEEPYVEDPPRYWMPPQVVPEGMGLVLGDNRNNSFDSHAWGVLPLESIQGVMAFRYWPLTRMGFLGANAGRNNLVLFVAVGCAAAVYLGRRSVRRKRKSADAQDD